MKAVYDDKKDIPAGMESHYEERDGRHVLKIEGELPGWVSEADHRAQGAKVSEFRESNVALKAELDKLRPLAEKVKAFEGVDPAEYKTLKEQAAALAKKGVKGADGVEAVIDAALKPLQEQLGALQADIKAEKDRAAELDKALRREKFEGRIAEAARAAKVADPSIDYAKYKAGLIFTEDDAGNIVAMQDGRVRYSPKDPSKPYTPAEFFEELRSAEPGIFKQSSGSGATGGGNGNAARVIKNPTAMDFGKNLEDIASGKATVDMGQ